MALLRPVSAKAEINARARQSILQTAELLPGASLMNSLIRIVSPLFRGVPSDPVYVPLFQRVETHVRCGEEPRDDSGTYIVRDLDPSSQQPSQ